MSRPNNPYKRPDHFSKKAKSEGFAARSVYKLDEVQRRFSIFRPGQRVVDLGCFPGSWSRFLLTTVGRSGRVVGVDLQEPDINGGTWIIRSVMEVEPEELREALGGAADVVVSDMAPRTTGQRLADHVAQIELADRALWIATQILTPGGAFVCKVFEGEDAPGFCDRARAHFTKVKRIRPEAVRKTSREFFLVGEGFSPDSR
jgi:23S rRNA (uridine2552-2'-O)-methyltransferase